MRLQSSFFLVSLGLLLAACQHQQPVQPDREAGNPFKYAKKSAVCTVTPIVKEQDGHWKTTMAVRSDDGECELKVQQPASPSAFLSFGLSEVPEHGKAFLYNYDQRTYVRYTPTTAYAGTDKFTVDLLQADGVKKTPLTVEVTVNNTGVVVAKPPVATPAKTTASSGKKGVRRKTAVRHRTVKKAVKK